MDYWVVSSFYQGTEVKPQTGLYATPFQAQTMCDKLMARRGTAAANVYTYGVRPATWQEREAAMFQQDIYQYPVWADEAFWSDAIALHAAHYTHISLLDPASIAFTEDDRKGEADRQTHMRPGKYLQKFLGAGPSGVIEHGPYKGEEPRITKMKVAFYAAWHQAGKRPPSDDVLEFTDDPERMVEAYEEGPDSCMMGKGWHYPNHPVQVYAAGDLELALLLCSTSGEVIGRALCWPAKEVFGRVYPTPNSTKERERYDELMARLKGMGWTSIEEDGDIFNGARLAKLEHRYGHYMMPYLDHEYGVYSAERDGKRVWIMDNSEHHQDNTDGTYNSGEPEYEYTCERCDDGLNEDDTCTVYSGWRSTNNNGRRGGYPIGDMTWCCYCRDSYAFYCDGADESFASSDQEVIEVRHNTYAEAWFWANGGYTCSWSDENFFRDEDPPVTLMDGSEVAPEYVDEASFRCLWDGQLWPKHFMSEAVPGYAVNADCLDVHPVEFVYVLPHLPLETEEDWQAWATGLAMASAAPRAEAEPDDPVVIDLIKSGLRYNPHSIHTPRRDLIDAIHATMA